QKLGIQVLPSPDMMAIMGAKDTLFKVAMLSIGSEDMLSHYTANEFATGFKKSLALQLRGIQAEQRLVMRGHHHKATWQLMHFTRCDGIYGLEGVFATGFKKSLAFQPHGIKQSRGSLAIMNVGSEDMLPYVTAKADFKKMPAFQPRGMKQSRGVDGHEGHTLQGLEDRLAHFTMEKSAAGVKKMSYGLRAIVEFD
ncbi:unnamed protein product, partial [Symbiodinium necroappetens]